MAASKTDITIVGAGLAGALLACQLADAGLEVSLYEYRPDPRAKGFTGGRSINLALSTRGVHGLRRASLAERVLADAIPMPGRMIQSPAGALSSQPYSKDRREAINSVSRARLSLTLIEAAAARPNVRLCFDHRCMDVDLDAPAATFERPGGTRDRVESGAVIGCDGAFSAVRGAMQRLDRFEYSQSYLEHGYKELTIPPRADGGFAMEPNALHIWPRGGYMMIALPNADRSFTCTCFWPFAGRNSFGALRTPEEMSTFFRANFPDAVPLMPGLAREFLGNPTGSLVTVRCAPWHHRGRVVLVGDAAHAIVPFYGQGMNAAFEDCAVLADCMKQHGSDRAAAFEAYFQQRKVNADAIADLAIENFVEMRDHVASAAFRLKKRGERVLHRFIPGYTPLYNMVAFSLLPSAEARRRARRHARAIRNAGWGIALLALAAILVALWGIAR